MVSQNYRPWHCVIKSVKRAVVVYNTVCSHASIEKLTPHEAHSKEGALIKTWKKLIRKEKQL